MPDAMMGSDIKKYPMMTIHTVSDMPLYLTKKKIVRMLKSNQATSITPNRVKTIVPIIDYISSSVSIPSNASPSRNTDDVAMIR